MNKQIAFENIADELIELYKAKNKAYGNSFGETFAKLGIISAITRISDKHNRLVNLATNPGVDNLGESIEDTLRDMANYCIMTLVELRSKKYVAKECVTSVYKIKYDDLLNMGKDED